MLHIEQRLALFRDMIGCCHPLYLWSYDQDLNLLESNCPEESLLNELFVSNAYAEELPGFFAESATPYVISNEYGLVWIAVPDMITAAQQTIHVLGPFFLYEVSLSQLERELHHRAISDELRAYVIQFLRGLPVISLNRAVEYVLMFHFCITGERIEVTNIRFLDHGSDITTEEELESIHGTYEAEQEMLRLVREGDLNFQHHMKTMNSTGRVGNISDGTALRQIKNMIIVSITLFSRAAMDGGLPPETAYALSDRYLQAVEKSNSIQTLTEINNTMQNDFVHRVHQYRQDASLSKAVRICLEQMRTRLEDNLTLESLARDLGYSPYYLSKKFRSETGKTFKEQLRTLRLERAKQLLRTTNDSIFEISERLQFCSQSYFTECFRKAEGCSPAEFRQSLSK